MKTFLEDIERFIVEEDDVPTDEENVGDAPVIDDMSLKISFGDLTTEKQNEIKDKILKDLNATDELSKNNLNKSLSSTPIFDGTVEAFRLNLGIENK